MTNAKVEVTKEAAEAIEFLKAEGWTFSSVMNVLTGGGFCRVDEAVALNTAEIEKVALAYLNGYEIERTPAEKVAEYYAKAVHDTKTTLPSVSLGGYERKRAIEFVAKAYGLGIEGADVK